MKMNNELTISQRQQLAIMLYVAAINQGPEVAGNVASEFDDDEARAVYQYCLNDGILKNRLVKPLWFNYKTQAMRGIAK
jgi:hypothetical protein